MRRRGAAGKLPPCRVRRPRAPLRSLPMYHNAKCPAANPPGPGLPLEAAPGAHLAAIATLAHVDAASNSGADVIPAGMLHQPPTAPRSWGDKRLQRAWARNGCGASWWWRELDWRAGEDASSSSPPFNFYGVRSGRV